MAAARTQPRLFLDLDGVLADFEAAVHRLLHKRPEDVPPRVLWGTIRQQTDFFGRLAPMPDAHELWEFSKPHRPTILTGKPMGE